jgi:hypothetical protein
LSEEDEGVGERGMVLAVLGEVRSVVFGSSSGSPVFILDQEEGKREGEGRKEREGRSGKDREG